MKRLLAAVLLIILQTNITWSQSEPLATKADIPEAIAAFHAWTEAFIEGDYKKQWQLTDPRITRWHPRKRWRRNMKKSKRRNGDITKYEIRTALVVTPEQIPCTELGHCYRKDVPVIIMLLDTEYSKNTPAQPEYVIMSKSDKGWNFGGGSFPHRPMGETSVIMTWQDEKKYEYDPTIDPYRN